MQVYITPLHAAGDVPTEKCGVVGRSRDLEKTRGRFGCLGHHRVGKSCCGLRAIPPSARADRCNLVEVWPRPLPPSIWYSLQTKVEDRVRVQGNVCIRSGPCSQRHRW